MSHECHGMLYHWQLHGLFDILFGINYHSDVTWVHWHVISMTTWRFVQHLVRGSQKHQNLAGLLRESMSHHWFPLPKGEDAKYISHYYDVLMSAIASQITSLTIVYSTIYSRHRSKKTSKPRVTWPLCREFTGTGEFPEQKASNAENVSIWWRHYAYDDDTAGNVTRCYYYGPHRAWPSISLQFTRINNKWAHWFQNYWRNNISF